MIRNVCLSLLLSFMLVSNAFSQNIFELKGKSIIIPPTTEQYENCVYTEQVLNKYKFKSEYLYQESILGDKIDILDVVHINKGKKKEAILLILKHKENKAVLYLPKRYKINIGKNKILSTCFYTTSESNFWGNECTTSLDSIFLYHYDAKVMDSIFEKFKSNIYYVGKKRDIGLYLNNRQSVNSMFQTPYKFKGITFKYENRSYYRRGYDRGFVEFQIPCFVLEVKNKEIYVPIKTDSIFTEILNNNKIETYFYDITLKEFLNTFETEEEYIENSKLQYDTQLLEYIRTKYVGREVYVKSKEHVEKGYYLFKDITLSDTYGKDIYLHYYALLESCENKRTYKFPITSDFEKHITFAECQRKIEAEETLKQAKKEAEYQAMLEKEEREYKANLIKKYGKRNALLILENAVQIGFTKEMCVEAWGEPYDINRTVTRNNIHEQWVYGIGRYLYFEGNILTAIQD